MNGATTEAVSQLEEEGLPLVLPRKLIARFEEADKQIRTMYGMTPGVPTLVRLWLACGCPSHIRKEFEMAVLGITKPGFEIEDEGDSDGDDVV